MFGFSLINMIRNQAKSMILFTFPHLWIMLPVLLLFLMACSRDHLRLFTEELTDDRYDSDLPVGASSAEIGIISRSVKKVYCVTYYTTYQFTREAGITGYHIASGKYLQSAWAILSTSESFSGSAVVAGVSQNHIALLTCAHIVNAPDTLFSFFSPGIESPIRLIKSISIKQTQEILIKELASCGSFSILAMDPASDIALIGNRCDPIPASVTPFCFHAGKSTALQWGNSVYILGYPMGTISLSRGIVSNTGASAGDSFSIDALLNKGFSGGIILAVRKGVPDFELVGLVKSMASRREYVLRPVSDVPYYGGDLPYEGEVFASPVENIQYGINYVIPIESLADFYVKNRELILAKGYNLDEFFMSDK
jgi:hypothetical protein